MYMTFFLNKILFTLMKNVNICTDDGRAGILKFRLNIEVFI